MLHPIITQKPIRSLIIVITLLNLLAEFAILRYSTDSTYGLSNDLFLALIRSTSLTLLTFPVWYIIKTIPGNSNVLRGGLVVIIPSLLLISIYPLILYGSEEFLTDNLFHQNQNEMVRSRLLIPLAITARSIQTIATFFSINTLFLLSNIKQLMLVHQQRSEERQNLIRQAEVNNLRAQINPHFLFNSLNSIAALTKISPEKAHDMVIRLSEFMRYSIRLNPNEMMTLNQEIKNIESYLNIEKTRFGERLEVYTNLSQDCLEAKLPNMMLQPIYENAIKHGVCQSGDVVRIFTRGTLANNELTLVIMNNFDTDEINYDGTGFGLESLKKRLSLQYGRTDLLSHYKIGNLFTLILTIPQQQ